MNSLKQRLENRTNAVITELNNMAKLSKYGDQVTDEQISLIEKRLTEELTVSVTALRERRDEIKFSLDDTISHTSETPSIR